MTDEEKARFKAEAIRLVAEHKRLCESPACKFSMIHIMTLMLGAGIELTDEERFIFT